MSEYSEIIKEAFMLGIYEAKKILEPKSDEMSQREAYDEFGRRFVEDAVKNGSVTVIQKGCRSNSKKVYSRAELVKIVAERNVLRSIIRLETTERK